MDIEHNGHLSAEVTVKTEARKLESRSFQVVSFELDSHTICAFLQKEKKQNRKICLSSIQDLRLLRVYILQESGQSLIRVDSR